MDLAYGSEARHGFLSNVGLIGSNGPHGYNLMAAEWTYQLSYNPGLMGVCVGPSKATCENIRSSKCFGIAIAASNQNVLASMAGGSSGKKYDKVGALKELGFAFRKAERLDVLLPDGGCTEMECEVAEEHVVGDHVLFVGRVLLVRHDAAKIPLLYHQGRYWQVGPEIQKPTQEERDARKRVLETYRKG